MTPATDGALYLRNLATSSYSLILFAKSAVVAIPGCCVGGVAGIAL